MKKRKGTSAPAKDKCPLCGGHTEKIVMCPACSREGCVERCNTGGVGCMCSDCGEVDREEA